MKRNVWVGLLHGVTRFLSQHGIRVMYLYLSSKENTNLFRLTGLSAGGRGGTVTSCQQGLWFEPPDWSVSFCVGFLPEIGWKEKLENRYNEPKRVQDTTI